MRQSGIRDRPAWARRETRPDQQEFRRKIAERDGLKCAISGCEVAEVLDGAYLSPRAPGGSDNPKNSVILRADLHRLFDAGLMTLDASGKVCIAAEVDDKDFRRFHDEIATTEADLANLQFRASKTSIL